MLGDGARNGLRQRFVELSSPVDHFLQTFDIFNCISEYFNLKNPSKIYCIPQSRVFVEKLFKKIKKTKVMIPVAPSC